MDNNFSTYMHELVFRILCMQNYHVMPVSFRWRSISSLADGKRSENDTLVSI